MKKSKNKDNTIDYYFKPNKLLLDLAHDFSKNYKRIGIGSYYSGNKKFQIDYMDKIRDKATGKTIKTGARISHKTGIIQMDESVFKHKEYTPDFIFFIILWCIVCKDVLDAKVADRITIEYYLKTVRSRKNLQLGYLKLFESVPSTLNNERYSIIQKMLKK